MSDDIRTRKLGSWGIITLTRAKALNSLTLEMCEEIDRALEEWAHDTQVRAVLVEGEGDRAFCAGGDIRWLYEQGKASAEEAANFFRTEYRMNTRIALYNKPYVALMDGICMGGGVGISMSASHRVATGRTMWAMPECGIGLIPDVGASYMLPKLASGMGNYLGLTGTRLVGADCMTAGVATHVVDEGNIATIREELLELDLSTEPEADINAVLNDHANSRPGELVEMLGTIREYFSRIGSIEALMMKLRQEKDGFGAHCLDQLKKASPTSLRLTLKLLNEAPEGFANCIAREFNVTANILAGQDFYEGVRAQVIDKDRNPQWSPARLSDVSDEDIAPYFNEPAGGSLDLSGL